MNKLLNEITKKEKELNLLYMELNSYIKTKTILNPNVKTFINYLLIYIEEPSFLFRRSLTNNSFCSSSDNLEKILIALFKFLFFCSS